MGPFATVHPRGVAAETAMEGSVLVRVVSRETSSEWRWIGVRMVRDGRVIVRLINDGVAFAPALRACELGAEEAHEGELRVELAVDIEGERRVFARRRVTAELVTEIRRELARERGGCAGGPARVRSCWPHFTRE